MSPQRVSNGALRRGRLGHHGEWREHVARAIRVVGTEKLRNDGKNLWTDLISFTARPVRAPCPSRLRWRWTGSTAANTNRTAHYLQYLTVSIALFSLGPTTLLPKSAPPRLGPQTMPASTSAYCGRATRGGTPSWGTG